ncbi:hypothetical protein ACU8KI_16080 [Rhizobium leguminosarum]
MKFLEKLYSKLEEPLADVLGHFFTTIVWLTAIFLTTLVMHVFHLDASEIPFLHIRLEDWITSMDIIAVTVVLGSGLWKSVRGFHE